MSLERVISLPNEVDPRSPFEWGVDDEKRPFEVDAWASLGKRYLSPQIASRHFFFLGETGSGKTKSAILPVLNAALRYGDRYPEVAASILVIDPKFELTTVLRNAKARNLTIIDPRATCPRIWLFEGRTQMSDTSAIVDYTLRNCSPSFVAAKSSRETFWSDSGVAIVEAFVAADILRPVKPELLWESVVHASNDSQAKAWKEMNILPKGDFYNYYQNAFKLISETAASGDPCLLFAFAEHSIRLGVPRHSLQFLHTVADAPPSQRAGQLAYALLFLRDLANPVLNHVVDLRPEQPARGEHGESLSIVDSISRGIILAFSPDTTVPVNDVIGRVLKTKFFEASFIRKNKVRPVFYICDEFHRFVTADPESGEQSFLDRCRAYRVICALATQSIASLRNGLAATSTNASGHLDSSLGVILGNTGNKLIFRNTDIDTQDQLKRLIPRSPIAGDLHVLDVHPLASLSPGTCYYMFADGHLGRASVALKGATSGRPVVARTHSIRLIRPVTIEEVLALSDEIERRRRYYWEQHFELEIDSPGGQTAALNYFLRRLDRWRLEGVCFSTLGLTSVASAAGLILSMGDIGSRKAVAGCQLLYHDARVSPSANADITRHSAASLAETMREMDSMHATCLAQHLLDSRGLPQNKRTIDFDHPKLQKLGLGFSGLENLTAPRFVEIYHALTAREVFISAEQAQLLRLIDEVI